MDVELAYDPHKFQLEVHEGMLTKRFGVVVAHRRFGKTLMASSMLTDAGLRHTKGDGQFAYLAPYLKQAKSLAWPVLVRLSLPIPGSERKEGALTVELPTGSKIRLFGADNYEAMRGEYFDGIVIDESKDIRPIVWDEIILPALADRKGWALFAGTPKGMANLFYQVWEMAGKNPDQWFRAIYRADKTIADLPQLEQSDIDLMRQVQSDPAFRQEWLCDWTASAANILITIDMVRRAQARVVKEADMLHLPKVVGVDVARFGDDRSAIFKRHGLIAYDPKDTVFKKIDNMTLAARVAQELDTFQPDATFVDGGRGEGVIDRLRQLGHGVAEVNFGGSPIDPAYFDRRAEMYDKAREWIEEGGMLPDNLDLTIDLTAATYDFSPAGKFRLESKDKIKERVGHSPDLGDAFALTFAEQVAASRFAGMLPGEVSGGHETAWDPDA